MDSLRTSSYSNSTPDCVEVGSYRKATYSYNGNSCVEVGAGDDVIGVRDTKQAGQPDRTELRFSRASWGAFLQQLEAKDRLRAGL